MPAALRMPPMQLHFDAATEQFRSELAAWLDAHAPAPADITERPRSSAHLPEWARRWQRDQFDAGWLVPGWPPELGGRNATPVQQMVYFEELARRSIVRSWNIQGVTIFAPSIVDYGTPEQRERYAMPVLRGDRTACLGMSEPGAGSDLAGLSTRADVYDDHFVLNGQKVWTSGAHDADFCICFVRTDPTLPKHRGISVLLLDMDMPGIEARPFPSLAGREHPDFNEVFFTDVVVPREHLLGDLNDGWRIANGSLAHERGMLWVVESARLDQTLETARHRAQGTDVAANQRFRDAYANAYVDALALKCLGYRGFAKFARGHDAPEHLMLKLLGSEACQRLFLDTAEALGVDALDTSAARDRSRVGEDWPWALRYLVSFGTTISGGTSEIQRNIVAERVLGLPRR